MRVTARLLPRGLDKMNLFLCSLDLRFLEINYTSLFWIRNSVRRSADYANTDTARSLQVEQSTVFIRRSYTNKM